MSRTLSVLILLVLIGCNHDAEKRDRCASDLGACRDDAHIAARKAEEELKAKAEEIEELMSQIERLKAGDDPKLEVQKTCGRMMTATQSSVIYDQCTGAASMDVEVDCHFAGTVLSRCRISQPHKAANSDCNPDLSADLNPPGAGATILTSHCLQGAGVLVKLDADPTVGPRVLVGSHQGFRIGDRIVDARSPCDLAGIGGDIMCGSVNLDAIATNPIIALTPSQPEQTFYFATVRVAGF